MSVSNIVGNTSNNTDAKKVPWANLVCNSLYVLNGIKSATIDATSIDATDVKISGILMVDNKPVVGTTVKNASVSGSALVAEPSPNDYEIRRLRAGTGMQLIDDPDYVEIASTVNSYSLAAARLGVDPSSNPGPLIGGLLFDPTLTTAGTFAIPLTSAIFGSGVCENFLDDVDNYFTLTSPTTLQINVSGKYNISGNVIVLTNDPLSLVALQVLPSVDAMFSSPPAMTNAVGVLSTGTTPISAIYSNIYTLGFAQDCTLVAGEIINMKLYAEGGSGGDTAEISLCSSLSIHLIGGTSSGAGTSGITAVNSLGTGETLLNPAGAGPVVAVKSLVAGSNITLTPTGNDITISATGGGSTFNGFYVNSTAPPVDTYVEDSLSPMLFNNVIYNTGSLNWVPNTQTNNVAQFDTILITGRIFIKTMGYEDITLQIKDVANPIGDNLVILEIKSTTPPLTSVLVNKYYEFAYTWRKLGPITGPVSISLLDINGSDWIYQVNTSTYLCMTKL